MEKELGSGMYRKNKGIWLFSQYIEDFGGTNTVISEAKKILSEANIFFHHVWVTNFSTMVEKRESQKLYFKALPIPVYLNNLFAGLKWRYHFKNLPYALVIGGSPVSGAIPLAANIPYIMWVGTSLLNEYSNRSIINEILNRNFSLFLNKLFIIINKIVEYHVLKKSKFIIVQSPYMLKSLREDYNICEKKMIYLPYPIKPKSQMKKKLYNKIGPKLLAVGRVDDFRKNYRFLLKAFSLLIKKYPESRLRIVGRVFSTSKLLIKCSKLGLNSFVDFLGEISNEKIAEEYKRANIFVLTPKQEGLGIVYLEAMSYGLPVITTKCGGPEGIVTNGLNGYLIEQNDLNAFVYAIKKIWDSEETYRKICGQAYNYILEKHNPDKFRKKFIEILKKELEVD